MEKFPKELRYSERLISNLVGSEDDFDTASKRMNHKDKRTTTKYYKLKPTIVTPLSQIK